MSETLSDIDQMILEMKIKMRPYQVKSFVKNFIKYMNKDQKEISTRRQRMICCLLNTLESIIQNRKKCHSCTSSLDSKSRFSPASRRYDLNLCESIQGPLVKGKKWEFLQSVQNLFEEFLSSKTLSSYERRLWAVKLCAEYCKLPRDVVLNWIISTSRP